MPAMAVPEGSERIKRVLIVKDQRPVNLNLATIHQPVAAIASITHRISGILVFIGIAILLWLLDISLGSEEGFNNLMGDGLPAIATFIVWVVLSALAFHTLAGIRHLFMDFGLGESFESGPRMARLTFIVSAIVIVSLGVWLW